MYWWLAPAWLLSIIGAYLLGFYLHIVKKRIEVLEEVVKTKVDKQPILEEPKSTIIDPDDPVQNAIRERDKIMKAINEPK